MSLNEKVLKILIIGDPATGKTSLIKRYCHDLFSHHHKTTIGVDFALKQTNVMNPKTGKLTPVRLQLWDIAGGDYTSTISRVFYKESLGALLVFDSTRMDTFQNVERWKKEIDTKVALPNGEALPVVLLANKNDLITSGLDGAMFDEFCDRHGFVGWFATSALSNLNIRESVEALIQFILSQDGIFEVVNPRSNLVLDQYDEKKSTCC